MADFQVKFYGLIGWVHDRSPTTDKVWGLLVDAAYAGNIDDLDDSIFPPYVKKGRRKRFPAHFPFLKIGPNAQVSYEIDGRQRRIGVPRIPLLFKDIRFSWEGLTDADQVSVDLAQLARLGEVVGDRYSVDTRYTGKDVYGKLGDHRVGSRVLIEGGTLVGRPSEAKDQRRRYRFRNPKGIPSPSDHYRELVEETTLLVAGVDELRIEMKDTRAQDFSETFVVEPLAGKSPTTVRVVNQMLSSALGDDDRDRNEHDEAFRWFYRLIHPNDLPAEDENYFPEPERPAPQPQKTEQDPEDQTPVAPLGGTRCPQGGIDP